MKFQLKKGIGSLQFSEDSQIEFSDQPRQIGALNFHFFRRQAPVTTGVSEVQCDEFFFENVDGVF